MRNISDIIEQHLKYILQQSKSGSIEIQRNELADKFQCVPSQINYVISTRFTAEKGYIVESKRGGGGYIRIRRIEFSGRNHLYNSLVGLIGKRINQSAAEDIILRLQEDGMISEREAQLMKAAISREVLSFHVPVRDELRAAILRAMITRLFMQ